MLSLLQGRARVECGQDPKPASDPSRCPAALLKGTFIECLIQKTKTKITNTVTVSFALVSDEAVNLSG